MCSSSNHVDSDRKKEYTLRVWSMCGTKFVLVCGIVFGQNCFFVSFLANRINGRAYATVLRRLYLGLEQKLLLIAL